MGTAAAISRTVGGTKTARYFGQNRGRIRRERGMTVITTPPSHSMPCNLYQCWRIQGRDGSLIQRPSGRGVPSIFASFGNLMELRIKRCDKGRWVNWRIIRQPSHLKILDPRRVSSTSRTWVYRKQAEHVPGIGPLTRDGRNLRGRRLTEDSDFVEFDKVSDAG